MRIWCRSLLIPEAISSLCWIFAQKPFVSWKSHVSIHTSWATQIFSESPCLCPSSSSFLLFPSTSSRVSALTLKTWIPFLFDFFFCTDHERGTRFQSNHQIPGRCSVLCRKGGWAQMVKDLWSTFCNSFFSASCSDFLQGWTWVTED